MCDEWGRCVCSAAHQTQQLQVGVTWCGRAVCSHNTDHDVYLERALTDATENSLKSHSKRSHMHVMNVAKILLQNQDLFTTR